MKYKVFISPSNQDKNMYHGKVANECENCEKIASYLSKALKRCGFDVMIAERNDDMATRCEKSRQWGADLHFSIHTNAYNGKAQGVEVYAYKNADKSIKAEAKKLANDMCKAIKGISPSGNNRGVKYATFQELEETPFCVYIEVDFHDNKEACDWLITKQDNIAETLAQCICNYFEVAYKEEDEGYSTGDIVYFKGGEHFASSSSSIGYSAKEGLAKITIIKKGAKHPYHLIRERYGDSTVYGWVDEGSFGACTRLYEVGDNVVINNSYVGVVKEVQRNSILVETETLIVK